MRGVLGKPGLPVRIPGSSCGRPSLRHRPMPARFRRGTTGATMADLMRHRAASIGLFGSALGAGTLLWSALSQAGSPLAYDDDPVRYSDGAVDDPVARLS